MTWKAFEGANGWYIAQENKEGFHNQPADSGSLTEEEAVGEAECRNSRKNKTVNGFKIQYVRESPKGDLWRVFDKTGRCLEEFTGRDGGVRAAQWCRSAVLPAGD